MDVQTEPYALKDVKVILICPKLLPILENGYGMSAIFQNIWVFGEQSMYKCNSSEIHLAITSICTLESDQA